MINDPKKEIAKPVQQESALVDQEKVLDEREIGETVEQPVYQEKPDQDVRKTIEAMELDDSQAAQAQAHANDAALLTEEEKISHLLETAKKKGVIFAVHVAKKMNDPYVLDMLHDRLAKEGYYKNFVK